MLLKSVAVALAIVLQIAILGPAYLIPENAQELSIRAEDLVPIPLVIALLVTALLAAGIYLALQSGRLRVASVLAALGLYLYLQFYLIVPDLGVFDGRAANFDGHWLVIALETVLLLALLGAALAAPRHAFNVMAPIVCAIALAEAVVIGADAASNSPPPKPAAKASPADLVDIIFTRTSPTRTYGIPEHSQRNVIVILTDTTQGDMFAAMLRGDPKLAEAFSGFTVYENTVGHFPYTGLSIPAIVTGTVYDGKETIPAFYKRVAPRRLSARLDAIGYKVDLLPLGSRGPFVDADREPCRAWTGLYDLALMRQLPTVLKEWQYNRSKFRITPLCGSAPTTRQELDPLALDKLIAESRVTRLDRPSYKFMHFYGMHPPSLLTASCDVRSETTRDPQAVLEQSRCVIGKIGDYFNKLRELGVFDDSLIVLTADHGTLFGIGFKNDIAAPGVPPQVISSANPAVAFKDFGVKGPVKFSEAPASLVDIYPTILARVGIDPVGAPGQDLARLEGVTERVRDFYYYKGAKEIMNSDYVNRSHWFTNRGHARDPDAWALTVSADDGETVRFVEPLAPGATARIVARLPSSEQMKIVVKLGGPAPRQTVQASVNGRTVASWGDGSDAVDREAVFALLPTERGADGVVEIKSEAATATATDGSAGLPIDWVKLQSSVALH